MSNQQAIYDLIINSDQLEKKRLTLGRGDFLTREGEIEQSIYVIIEGAIHAFYVSEHEECTIRFGYEGSVITSIPSFYNQKPSVIYLQALRKTEVLVISRESFFKAKEEDSTLNAFYIESLERLAEQQMEREIDLLTSSPIERLRRVKNRSPKLFQEVPAKYIASYLRMTPETLSRIQKS